MMKIVEVGQNMQRQEATAEKLYCDSCTDACPGALRATSFVDAKL